MLLPLFVARTLCYLRLLFVCYYVQILSDTLDLSLENHITKGTLNPVSNSL